VEKGRHPWAEVDGEEVSHDMPLDEEARPVL
jgi:hypothetical protein